MKKTALALALVWAAPLAAEQAARRTLLVHETARIDAVPDIVRVDYIVADESDLTKSVGDLAKDHDPRVQATKAHLESVCGEGKVCVTPRIDQVQKLVRDQKTGESEYKVVGQRIVSHIDAKLEGEGEIAQKLGKLYDTSKMDVTTVGSPVTDLSDARLSESKVKGLEQNLKNSEASAKALLRPGEKLGKLLRRTDQHETSSAMYSAPGGYESLKSMAMPRGGGDVAVQTGKRTVTVTSTFEWEVVDAKPKKDRKSKS